VTPTDDRYVLDGGDRIITAGGSLEDTIGPFLGHSLWDVSPQAKPLFAPHFAKARETGLTIEFTSFYAGVLARRRVVPTGQTLTVHVTPLEVLNVRTLGTLTASLRRIAAALADQASEPRGPRAPGSLQAQL
jgi:hypothetical protein